MFRVEKSGGIREVSCGQIFLIVRKSQVDTWDTIGMKFRK
jgi:hypothetical protein